METTASISTKFCTTIETTKVVIVGGPNTRQTIQDGGRPPLKNIKLPYLCSRLTDFYEIWQGYAYWLLSANQPLKFRIFKIQDGGGRHLKNHKNCDIYATVRLIFTKSGTVVRSVL